jgi:uncharacterized membrane protein YeaQ/YmgE (transglycosylase-associated protein family)
MFLLIYIILVGLVAGWATGKLMKGSGYGVLMDILLGIAGGIVGAFILRVLGFYSSGGLISSILDSRCHSSSRHRAENEESVSG